MCLGTEQLLPLELTVFVVCACLSVCVCVRGSVCVYACLMNMELFPPGLL